MKEINLHKLMAVKTLKFNGATEHVFTASIINQLAGSTRYGEPVGSTTVNSLVR